MTRRKLAAAALLVLIACAQKPTTRQAAPSPSPDAAEFPTTTITTKLDRPFAKGTFDPAMVGGLAPGDIEAHWYTSGDFWSVFFEGLDLDKTGPLCPGNSIEIDGAFQFVTNDPTTEGACEGVQTARPTTPSGVFNCEGRVLYVTKIPKAQEGFLWGTVEKVQPDGSVAGITSRVATAPSPPEIDPDDFGCNTL